MNGRPALDVSHLTSTAFKTRAPLWWAGFGIILIESTMFALLIATYFYIRLSMDVWPPPGVSYPGLVLPTVNLFILLVSCIPAYLATGAAVRNDVSAVRLWLIANFVLAVVALAIRVVEWRSFNFNWTATAYGSIVWMIMGLHTFDYVAAVLETAVLIVIVITGRFGDKQRSGVDLDSLGWYLVVGAWIPLYVVVYWMPYVLGSGRT